MSEAKHTPGANFSQASIRRDVANALRPLKLAINAPVPDEKVNVPTAHLYGFRFTGCRFYRGRASKFAWYAEYTGTNADGVRLNGTLGAIAEAMYWHFRRAANQPAKHPPMAEGFANPGFLPPDLAKGGGK